MAPYEGTRTPRGSRPLGRRALRVGILVALLLLVAEGVSLSLTLRDLSRGADLLIAASKTLGRSPAGWTTARIAAARADLDLGQALVRPAHSRLDADPLLAALGVLPLVGDQVRTLRDLGDGADSSAGAARDYLVVAERFNATRADHSAPGGRLISLLQVSRVPLEDASSRLTRAVTAVTRDSKHSLLAPLRSRVNSALAVLVPTQSQAALLAQASRIAPSALGAGTPKTYLLLFANPAEIRPAGGFVGAAGSVTMNEGSPQQLDIRPEDSYRFKETFPAPEPLLRFFNFQKAPFEIGDAGWDPDFPTTARLTERMFKSATDKSVDGTVSMDPYAISAALAITGPLEVPGIGTFDQVSFFPQLDFIVNVKTGPGSGKAALPVIARVIVQKVLSLPADDWPRLLAAMQEQATQRHIQLYIHDPDLAAAAARAHYDGAVLPGGNDYLMVVDGNVTPSKGDYYVHKSVDLKAEVTTNGVSRHQLTLTYTMPLPVDNTDRVLNKENGGVYADSLRVYLPETTANVGVNYSEDGGDGFGGLDTVSTAGGKRILAAFIRLPRGHTGVLRIDYGVALDGGRAFDLYVQKQAGVPNRHMDLTVSYPGGVAKRVSEGTMDTEFMLKW